MNKVKILSCVLAFSVLVTSLFSVQSYASSYVPVYDKYTLGALFLPSNTFGPTETYTLYNNEVGGGTLGDSTLNYVVPDYSSFFVIHVRHQIYPISSDVLMTSNNTYNFTLANFMIYADFYDRDNDVWYNNCPAYDDGVTYHLYYTDGTSALWNSVSSDSVVFDSSTYTYSVSLEITPEKDVSYIILETTSKVSISNLYDLHSPYYYIHFGSYHDLPIGLFVEEVGSYNGILGTIKSFLSSIFGTVSSGLSSLMDGVGNIIDTITSKLSSLGTTIVNKLSTVQSGIVNAVSNVVSGICTLKDSLLDRLTSVKDGIVDKLENISVFFGFNSSGQSELDDLNSGLNDSSNSMEEAAGNLDDFSSETIDIDSVVSDGLQSEGSDFLSSFTEIVDIPMVSRGFITVFSVALIGYVLYGKKG